MKLRIVWPIAFAAVSAAWFAPALGLSAPLWIDQTGDSMPVGLYELQRDAPIKPGAVVVIKRPSHFNLWWLMKRVEGMSGDVYCWRPDLGTHTLAGRIMPPPAPEAIAMGVPVWHECRALDADELVGYGQSATSYDSRYFGPIRLDQIWGVYRLHS